MATKNFTMLAQNNANNYVLQACLSAMSIHASNKDVSICLITNDPVPSKYKKLFDHIVEIPWGDHAEHEDWKISNRWKIYHAIPYDETVVIDTDMLVLQDISSWFDFLQNYDLFYTSKVYSYRGELVDDTVYRQAFNKFNLPNLYSGFHYFKKSNLAHEFYTWLEMITNNWQQFYKAHAGGKIYQKVCSMDVSAAIAAKIMNIENKITNSNVKYPSFTHMKPRIQNWKTYVSDRWQDRVEPYLSDDLTIKIGNYTQTGILHYTEKDFVSEEIIQAYEKHLGIS
jgi:hypothetical protein